MPILDASVLADSAVQLLATDRGPVHLSGPQGQFVVMRLDDYEAMLGFVDDDEAENIAAIKRGLADAEAGRVTPLKVAFDELRAEYGVQR
jgi:PHD/YefM family antitoxin component YafN of YafNO toxin-antitoxin module